MTRMDAEDAAVSIGQMLGTEATRREISHEAAAELCGVSQATFSRWVNGANLPGTEHWTKLARFLRIPRDRLAEVVRESKRSTPDRLAAIEARLGRIEADLRSLLDG